MSELKVPYGVIPVPPTPFDAEGEINFPVLGRMIDYMIEGGVHWICIGGSSSEYTAMSAEERRALLKYGAEAIGDRVPKMASTGCHYLKHTLELTQYAIDLGYDAIMLLTPYHMKAGAPGMVDYYKTVAAAFPEMGFVIYDSPGLTNVDIPREAILELADVPNIVGIKHSVGIYENNRLIDEIRTQGKQLNVMQGNDQMLLVNLAQGGRGVISNVSALLPRELVTIYERMMANDLAGAQEADLKVRHMISLLQSGLLPGPIKAALKMLGFDCGAPRLPVPPCSAELEQKLRAELRLIGYDV